MGLSINQNIAAVNAYHNLSNTQNDLSKSLEKLSSGFRINRAADDAAGLAISEGLRSQIGGLKVAVRNAQDGTSVVQTAEGALNESTSILQRMRDLSVQASNDGGLSADAKGNIQSEMGQLKSELTRIADTTTFNGTKLLDGSYTGSFQVGANVGERINVGVATSMGAVGLGVGGVDVTTAAGAGYISGLKEGDTIAATAATNTSITPTGTLLNNIKAGAFSIDGIAVDTTSLNGTTDSATTVAAAINGTIGMSAVATASVDSTGKLVLTSASKGATGTAAQVTVTGADGLALFTGSPVAGADAKVATATDVAANDLLAGGADKAIKAIDAAISTVSTVRANLGAVQNRFDHTVKNLNVAVENLSASESRIRDTDMASEMVSFTRSQILSQAGTSMLAQANQLPQSVLKLLG